MLVDRTSRLASDWRTGIAGNCCEQHVQSWSRMHCPLPRRRRIARKPGCRKQRAIDGIAGIEEAGKNEHALGNGFGPLMLTSRSMLTTSPRPMRTVAVIRDGWPNIKLPSCITDRPLIRPVSGAAGIHVDGLAQDFFLHQACNAVAPEDLSLDCPCNMAGRHNLRHLLRRHSDWLLATGRRLPGCVRSCAPRRRPAGLHVR